MGFFQKCIIAFKKFFLFWVPMNIKKDRKAKLESAYSFMLKCSKITLCFRMKLVSIAQNAQQTGGSVWRETNEALMRIFSGSLNPAAAGCSYCAARG